MRAPVRSGVARAYDARQAWVLRHLHEEVILQQAAVYEEGCTRKEVPLLQSKPGQSLLDVLLRRKCK